MGILVLSPSSPSFPSSSGACEESSYMYGTISEIGVDQCTYLLLVFVLFQRVGVGQVVDGDGQEDVEEDVVATDEQDDKVEAGDDADAFDPAEGLDAVVHYHVPVLTGEDLRHE